MRIDRSDLADEPGNAHMARPARSAPDDPDAAGKDQTARRTVAPTRPRLYSTQPCV